MRGLLTAIADGKCYTLGAGAPNPDSSATRTEADVYVRRLEGEGFNTLEPEQRRQAITEANQQVREARGQGRVSAAGQPEAATGGEGVDESPESSGKEG